MGVMGMILNFQAGFILKAIKYLNPMVDVATICPWDLHLGENSLLNI
jgi:hypothetical protein